MDNHEGMGEFFPPPARGDMAWVKAEFESQLGVAWTCSPQPLSLEEQLLGATKRLLRAYGDLKAENLDLKTQVRSLLDDKGLMERQLLKREDLSQRLNEQLRDAESRLKVQTDSFQKEFRSGEIRRQALENDLKRLKNEQKEKSFTVVKNTLKSGFFINLPPPKTDPPMAEGLLRIENKALLAQLQDVQGFKREVHLAANRLSAKIEESYELRRKYLVEGLRADGFEFGYFELLKQSHVPEQGWYTADNAKALLEKMERHLQFQDLFDRFLSQRFEGFYGDQRRSVVSEGPDRKWEKLIFNDLHKIGDTVFLQCATQNFKEITGEHLRLLQLEQNVEAQRSALDSSRQVPKSMFNEFYKYREKVDRLIEEIASASLTPNGQFGHLPDFRPFKSME
jgi:hypothetical protein